MRRYGAAGFHLKEEDTQQETILIIPGAARMDRVRLQEMIHKAQEGEFARMRERGPHPRSPKLKRLYSDKEIGKALKERSEWMQRQQAGKGKVMFTSTTRG